MPTWQMVTFIIAFVIVSYFAFLTIYDETKTLKIAVFYSDLFEVTKAVDAFMNENNANFEIKKVRFEATKLDEIFKNLKADNVKIIIGPSYSEEASMMLPFLQKYDLYAISPTVTSDALVGKNGRIASMCVSDHIQVKKMIDAMKDDGVTELFVFASTDNRAYVDPYVKMLAENFPGTIVLAKISAPEEITPETLEKAKEFSGVYFVTPGLVTGYIVSKLEELGYTDHLYASDYALDEKLLLFDSELLKSVKVFAQVSGRFCTKMNMDFVGTYNALLFINELTKRYGRNLQNAFGKIEDFNFQGIDGPVKLENYYANKETSVIALEELMTIEK